MHFLSEDNEIRPELLNFITGFGDGELCAGFLRKMDQASRLVVYEPDSGLFYSLCEQKNISEMLEDERFTLVLGDDESEDEFAAISRSMIEPYNVAHIISIIQPGFENVYGDVFEKHNRLIRSLVEECNTEIAGMQAHGELPCKNELFALSKLAENKFYYSFLDLIGSKRPPVILVGAGPSLDKNVEMLKLAKGRALIIAAGHAAKRLAKAGIYPDIFAVLDPKDDGFLDDEEYEGCYLLCSARGDARVQEKFRGRVIYYDFSEGIFPADKYCNTSEIPEHGGSVMTYAYALLTGSGIDRIIMAGMDLAYNDRGETHSGGEYRAAQDYYRGVKVPGYYGGYVETREDWYSYLKFFEDRLEKDKGITVIDATEGGALIKGSIRMELKDALEEYCRETYPVKEWLASVPPAMSEAGADSLRKDMRELTLRVSRLDETLKLAVHYGSMIIASMDAGVKPGDIDGKILGAYDRLYHDVMETEEGMVLIYYCEDLVQDYIQNAVKYEASGDIAGKLKLENTLFKAMAEKLPALKEYMQGLFLEGRD